MGGRSMRAGDTVCREGATSSRLPCERAPGHGRIQGQDSGSQGSSFGGSDTAWGSPLACEGPDRKRAFKFNDETGVQRPDIGMEEARDGCLAEGGRFGGPEFSDGARRGTDAQRLEHVAWLVREMSYGP